MHVYQAEEGQIGLTLVMVLSKRDLKQILGHDPLNIRLAPLRIQVFFCEPPQPVSFDIHRSMYSIHLCFKDIGVLKEGSSVIVTHLIEDVQFTLVLFFESSAHKLSSMLRRL